MKLNKKELFYYCSKTLQFKKINTFKFLIPILSILLLLSVYFLIDNKYNRPITPNTLENIESDILVLNVKDTLNDFSEEKLILLLKSLNVKFPHIVLAQAQLESGHYKSKIFLENHNLFGMKEAKVRVHTSKGTQYNHAYYLHWRESVYDYAFYQCRYLSSLKTEEEYYIYLDKSYAEADNYVNLLKSMVKKQKLKEKFFK